MTSTEIGLNAAWNCPFSRGRQDGGNKFRRPFAWAVRDGDVPDITNPSGNNPIPESSTLLLGATGLLALAGYRWSQRRRERTQVQ